MPMKVKALVSFCGKISMAEGEVRDIEDLSLVNDLKESGYIEPLEEKKEKKPVKKKTEK